MKTLKPGYQQVKNNKLDPQNSYYVYIHRRLSDNQPFYVGKGNKYRAWVTSGRSQYWNRVVNKHGLKVDIVFDKLSEDESFQCEKDIILELKYFGYSLTNLTSGGEGTSNPSAETRRKMSMAKVGKIVGNKNPFADKIIYSFVRVSDGLEVSCTRSDLIFNFKLTHSLKKLFLKKNARKTACGWKLKGST